jgi:uncharacterized protein
MPNLMNLSPFFQDIFLFIATTIGETLGSVIGGGSFITQPAILLAGFTMHQAIALDITASCLTSVAGLATFSQAGRSLAWKVILPPAAAGIAGAVLGPLVLEALPTKLLAYGFALAALIVAGLTFSSPSRQTDSPSHPGILIGIGFVLGFYTGLSGAGSGIIAVALFTRFGGLSTLSAVVARKFVFIPATLVSAVSYILQGILPWRPLIPMALACLLAGWVGTRIMLKLGDTQMSHVIRIAALFLATLMVFKLSVFAAG